MNRKMNAGTEQVFLRLMREMDFQKRFDLVNSLSRTARDLSRRAVARAHPGMSERNVDLLFVEYHYGVELADKLRAYVPSPGP